MRPPLRRAARIVAVGAGAAAAALALSAAAGWLVALAYGLLGREPPEPDWLVRITERLSGAGSPREAALAVLSLALSALVFAPVAEEFLFRGLLQDALSRLTRRAALAVPLTAVAFAAVHGSIAAAPPLFAVSLCFSAAKSLSGGLAAPVLAHFLYNAAVLALAAACE